jgi:hypothetical protein
MSNIALDNKNYITEYVWRYRMSMHSHYVMEDVSIEVQYRHIGREVNYVMLSLNRGRYWKSEEARLKPKPEQDN